MSRYKVVWSVEVEIEVKDPEVLSSERVSSERAGVAHLARMLAEYGYKLSKVDGWADLPDTAVEVTSSAYWRVDYVGKGEGSGIKMEVRK
jgi:N-acetyl-anhydromuramyl-L-alanine amidase AmpD